VFSGLLSAFTNTLRWVQENRTREMLAEDFIAFGGMRSIVDLLRPQLYHWFGAPKPLSSEEAPSRPVNWIAFQERLGREILSILTDNVSGGVFAYAIGALVARKNQFANAFVSLENLELFQTVLRNSPMQTPITDKTSFLRALAHHISPQKGDVLDGIIQDFTTQLSELSDPHAMGTLKQTIAKKITETLVNQPQGFDIPIPKIGLLSADALVDDLQSVLKHLPSPTTNWLEHSQALIDKTLHISRLRIPVSLGLAMGLTFSVPYFIRSLTRKVYGMDGYPAELGLRKVDKFEQGQQKTWAENWFPYVTQSLENGNPLPLIGSFWTLPFALGVINPAKITQGLWKESLNIGPGYVGRLLKMLQFGKGFPFTTLPQMAACFSVLITSRMLTSRTDIEMRERTFDSVTGFSSWIFLTPIFKKLFAGLNAPKLLKTLPNANQSKVFKQESEIRAFMPDAEPVLKQHFNYSLGALATTLGILGIVEPVLSTYLSFRQARQPLAAKTSEPKTEPPQTLATQAQWVSPLPQQTLLQNNTAWSYQPYYLPAYPMALSHASQGGVYSMAYGRMARPW
jgi:hypothetical protein